MVVVTTYVWHEPTDAEYLRVRFERSVRGVHCRAVHERGSQEVYVDTQAALTKAVGSSQSRVPKMESGDPQASLSRWCGRS